MRFLQFSRMTSLCLLSGGVLSSLFWSGCAQPPAPPPPPAAQVTSSTPVKTPIVEWDEYVGRLDPVDYVEVRARVSGYLDSTNFQEGQIVKAGDLLCVIDPRPFEAEVRRTESEIRRALSQVRQANATVLQVEAEVQEAQARFDLAQKQLARSQKLVLQNAISQDDFDIRDSEVSQASANLKAVQARLELAKTAILSAEAAVNSAKTQQVIAQLNLDYTQVKSPITGRVSSRLVTEGNLISGGAAQSTLITTIVSIDPIYCHFDADEHSFLKYSRLAREGKLGDSREVKHPVYVGLGDEEKEFPHPGYMDFVDNRLDPETGTMRCRAILSNPDLSLTPGLFTRVRLPGSGRYEAVLIPDSAIGTDQSEKFVFVIDAENKVNRQVVKLGPLVQGLRLIRSGLDGSEQIVLRGMQRVRPGATVVATHEATVPQADGLPTDSQPVPKEQWLSRQVHEPRGSAGSVDGKPVLKADARLRK
ncbi:efflux RND transporter periplasmic adaptor subunit [Planctomicrobium piriforme]|uniref:Membrane fusion protein, multidrug efflux system/membrane fusion protein, multidrug efflux system n=1 Tax=Planctomicrobium piriforme TaxID=1576369 RepID=A0A1I3RJ41_9PLAN|nr:efflux RND transporter periplasmic adaptor subunit [Planctomicrobium piriforme]SFJ46060.1 membrane fusion protein, multidrug efflux system/membrane fusion protein, multidrug efflux system [Planctomicrobium piriforme]